MLIESKKIKKPRRFLLPDFYLGCEAQDLYALLLLRIKEEFDRKFFGKEPIDHRTEIISSLPTDYIFSIDDLSGIFNLTKKVLLKKKNNKFVLKIAVQELRRAEVIHHVYSDDEFFDCSFRVTGLINWGDWNGSKLILSVDPYIAYEFIEYSHNGGFSLIDQSVFFKLRNPISKRIFELISSDKRMHYKCNFFDFLKSVISDEFNEKTIKRDGLIKKYLVRPIDVLIRDSNGLVTHNDGQGYVLHNLGGSRGNTITKDTILEFTLENKNKKIISEPEKLINDKESNVSYKKAFDLYNLIKECYISNDGELIIKSICIDDISKGDWINLYRNICDIDLYLKINNDKLITNEVRDIISVMALS